MTTKIRWVGLMGVLILAGTAVAADEPRASERDERRSEKSTREAQTPPSEPRATRRTVYIPPSRGTTRTRTGGGTRAPSRLPQLAALAPDHVGLTTHASPTLTWFVAGPASAPLELTLLRDGGVEPALEVVVATEVVAGIGQASLSEWGVELEEGAIYQWSVALVDDPAQRDRDVVASGAIERVLASPALESDLDSSPSRHRVLASHGIWYDALSELGRRIATGDERLRSERAALLDQVGLGEPAAFERARAR